MQCQCAPATSIRKWHTYTCHLCYGEGTLEALELNDTHEAHDANTFESAKHELRDKRESQKHLDV